MQNAELQILYAIQNLHTPALDAFMVALTKAVGSYGTLWVAVGILLCFFKKTRKGGIAALISYALVYLGGNLLLKDLIARPRPCHVDETVALLVSRPSSFSCPSTHTGWSFGAASAISRFNKKLGGAAFLLAVIIAFSRMYLFVHFPTDVLLGAVLGCLFGSIASAAVKKAAGKKGEKKEA